MICGLSSLPVDQVTVLAAMARSEGYRFIDRLLDEWLSGVSRFDGPGERLMGDFEAVDLVAIGGLHRDPYADDIRTGRLRRFYVAPTWRRCGRGRLLVQALLDAGRGEFDVVRLRVPDQAAGRFYESIGFVPTSAPDCTHVLPLGAPN